MNTSNKSNSRSKLSNAVNYQVQNPSFIDNNKSYFEVDFKNDTMSKYSSQTEQSISKIVNDVQTTKHSGVSNQNITGSNDQTYIEYSRIFGPNKSQDTNSFHERFNRLEDDKHNHIFKPKNKKAKNKNLLGNNKCALSNNLLIKNIKSIKATEENNRLGNFSSSNKNISYSDKEFQVNPCLLKNKDLLNFGKKCDNKKENERQIKDFKYSISKDSSNENNENSYKITDSYPDKTIRTNTDNNEIENFNETERTNKGGDSQSSNKIPNVIRNQKKKKTKSNNPLDAKFTIDLLKEEDTKEEEIFRGLELRDILNNDFCEDMFGETEKADQIATSQTKSSNNVVDSIHRPDSPDEVDVDYSVDTEEFKFNLAKSSKVKNNEERLPIQNISEFNVEPKPQESRFLDFFKVKNSQKEKTINTNNLNDSPLLDKGNGNYKINNHNEDKMSEICLTDLIYNGENAEEAFKEIDGMTLINSINKFHPNHNNISEINDINKNISYSTIQIDEGIIIGRDSTEGRGNINNSTLNLAFLNKNSSNVKEYIPKSKVKKANLHIMTENNNTPNKEINQIGLGFKNFNKINQSKLHFTCPEESTNHFLTSNKTSRKSSNKNIFDNSQVITPPKTNQFMTINTSSINQNNLNVGLLGLFPNSSNNSQFNNTNHTTNLVHPHTTTNSSSNHNLLYNTNFIKSQNHKPYNINQQNLNYNVGNTNFHSNSNNSNISNINSINGINSLNNYHTQYFINQNQKHLNNMNNPHHKSNNSNSTLHSSNQVFNPQYLNNTTITNNTNTTNLNNQSSQKNSINQASISYHNDSEHYPEVKFQHIPSKISTEESLHSLNSCNINFNTIQSPTNLNGNFSLNAYSRELNKNFSSSFTGNNMSNPYSQNFFGVNNTLMPQTTKINLSNLGVGMHQMYQGLNPNIIGTQIPGSNMQIKFPKAPVKPTLITSSSCFGHNLNNNTIKEVFDFEVRLEDIAARIETRTTLMIKNVPNKYTLENVLNEIDEMGFKNKYVFFYLPPDLEKSTNKGFSFIKFSHAYHILCFYETFQDRVWKRYCSSKKCEIKMAKFQSFDDIKRHHENKNEKKTSWISDGIHTNIVEVPTKFVDIIMKNDSSVTGSHVVREGISVLHMKV